MSILNYATLGVEDKSGQAVYFSDYGPGSIAASRGPEDAPYC
jgi:hypothetical protein